MNPKGSEVHIDALLTQVSQQIPVQAERLIGTKVFKEIKVKKDSDKIATYGKEHLRVDDDLYVGGTRAKTFDWSVSTANAYTLQEHAKETKIIWADRDNADEPIKYEQDTIQMIRDNQLVIFENKVATALDLVTNYTSTDTATAKWNLFNDSDPLADIDAGKVAVHDLIGMDPNTIVLPYRVYNLLRRHPKLIAFYNYVVGGRLTLTHLQELFEIQNILIGDQMKVSSKEGQTVALTGIWDNSKIPLLYIPPNVSTKQISFGYSYRKVGYPYVDRWEEQPIKSDIVRVNDKYDFKIQSEDCGFLLTGVL